MSGDVYAYNQFNDKNSSLPAVASQANLTDHDSKAGASNLDTNRSKGKFFLFFFSNILLSQTTQ